MDELVGIREKVLELESQRRYSLGGPMRTYEGVSKHELSARLSALQAEQRAMYGQGETIVESNITHVSPSCPIDEIVSIIKRDGAVIVDCLAERSLIQQVKCEVDALKDAEYRGEPGSFAGEHTARNGGYVLERCPSSQQLFTNPIVLSAARKILEQSCRRIRLAVASSIRIEGGQTGQVLHRDDTEWPVDLLGAIKPGTEIEVSAMWAVTDFTQDNGATCVVPGSHLWERTQPLLCRPCQACMSQGSVLIYTGSVIHGGGPSLPEASGRQGLLGSYVLGWLHPEFNFHFTMPIEKMAAMNAEMRDLLGFAGINRYNYRGLVGPSYATEYTGPPLPEGQSADMGSSSSEGIANQSVEGRSKL